MSFEAFIKVESSDAKSVDAEHKGWLVLFFNRYGAMQSISHSADSSARASTGNASIGS
ncbi:Hcp1 family type VI secretion system effector [Pseudomonas syringae pv. actinidiae]|nr:Hcp1 family type VI secretion system effector [Pseudomonas syringae pv. actinidiae]